MLNCLKLRDVWFKLKGYGSRVDILLTYAKCLQMYLS